MTPIKQFFFDFGGVLVDLDFDGAVQSFQKLGITTDGIFNSGHFKKILRDFENGKTAEKVFFDQLRDFGNFEASDEEIRRSWNIVIQTIPAYKLELLRTLRQHFPVYMVSNTNITHIEYTRQHLFREGGSNIDDYFDKLYLSYELGASKPDMEFYRKVIDDAKANPAESLFIDDKEENIEGARKAGFQVCRVTPDENLREKISPFLTDISL